MKLLAGAFAAFFSIPTMAQTQRGFTVEPYGFLKSSAMYATEGLASFNNINLSAPTHAMAQTRTADEKSRMSFQAQQSRIGAVLKKEANLSAKFEFDFIDFNKSSPTTQMNPRVRIATVTYLWGNHKVVIGQDWDLFSPVSAFTFDYVGNYFMAGNTGFMRQQAQFYTTSGSMEYGAALGMAGNNPGITDADLEIAKSPSYAARASYALEEGRVGLSGIYARLHYDANESTHDAYGVNLFFEKKWSEFSIKSEAYYGQNLANIGALAIGKGTSTSDVKEYGANITASYQVSPRHIPFGGLGFARADNRREVSAFALNATNQITNPGVLGNMLARLGHEFQITPDFSWINEISRYETSSHITTGNKTQIVYGLESGVQLRF
jgi:hypothetical protein